MLSPSLAEFNEKKFFLYRLTPSARPDKIWAKTPLYEGGDSTKLMSAEDAKRQLALLGAAQLPPVPKGQGDFFYDLGRHTDNGELSEVARDLIASYKARLASGHCLGYQFTADSGRFFYDIDGCRNPETGQLTPIGAEAVNFFRTLGAYIEVSASGCGIHIVGRYTGPRPTHGCTNKGLGLELYTDGRGMAIGTPCEGNPDADCTGMLTLWLIPAYFMEGPRGTEKRPWTTEAEEGWDGPESDDELITLFLNGRKDKTPTNRQLWEGDVKALTAWNREPGRADGISFDPTKADMTFAGAMNFYTGNNFERTHSLMRQSPYSEMRLTKWADDVLMRKTIPSAYSDEIYRKDYAALKAFSTEAVPMPAGASDVPTGLVVRSDAEAERRRKQIAENIRIGAGVRSEDCPTSPVVSLEDMLENFCKIKKGKRLIDFRNTRSIFSFDEWKSSLKQSVTFKDVKGDPYHDATTGGMKKKAYETLEVWNAHPGRKEVETVTFRPGHEAVTIDPLSKGAANTWRAIERKETAGDVGLFLRHVEYLFAKDAPRFLDWLAHIEQFPGDLTTTAWVHISPHQGTGRNWLASVLCKIWEGYAAGGFDLAESLRNGFNEELSQKLLVVVDEINEGGSNARWDNAEKLKSLVTTETRLINEKYGHKALEWNCARWLILSNHTSALPLTEADRRFNVVRNDERPMTPAAEYYGQLYAALKDPAFIASVAWMLKTRDISAFNPGEHAVMNDAKRDMVAASKSEADEIIAHLIETHPADVITNSALGALLNNQPFGKMTPHHRHALERAGVRPYGKSVRLGSRIERVSILRNHQIWKEATTYQIQAEIAKGSTTVAGSLTFEEFAKVTVN
jgi:primase-polymerase (primpol)-like protein